jgi:hypothetical protein
VCSAQCNSYQQHRFQLKRGRGTATVAAPTFATARLRCMATMKSAPEKLMDLVVSRRRCNDLDRWRECNVQVAMCRPWIVRRLQECRRCIRSLAGGWPASLSSRLSSSFPLAQSKIPHAPCCTSATYSGNSTREADHITRLDLPCNAAIVCRAAGCRVETLALTGVPDTDRRPTL